ncbi:MAG: lysophospholipid acyltransferase family protein [Chloroflexota bacterium]|nr:lysophospholipid acyltransferase family protein [Chloroflexota bacterium]
MAKKELFKCPFNILLKFYGAYPINRTRPGSSAIKWVKEQLQTKESSLLIFPEGTRSRDLRLQKGLNGAAMIAIDTQSIILPVSIVGSEKCKNYLQFLFPKMSVKIKIGKPFNIVNLPEKKDKDLYQIITKEIMQRISNMLPQAYKDDEDELEFCYTRAIEN